MSQSGSELSPPPTPELGSSSPGRGAAVAVIMSIVTLLALCAGLTWQQSQIYDLRQELSALEGKRSGSATNGPVVALQGSSAKPAAGPEYTIFGTWQGMIEYARPVEAEGQTGLKQPNEAVTKTIRVVVRFLGERSVIFRSDLNPTAAELTFSKLEDGSYEIVTGQADGGGPAGSVIAKLVGPKAVMLSVKSGGAALALPEPWPSLKESVFIRIPEVSR
jgi:hypothetical protein